MLLATEPNRRLLEIQHGIMQPEQEVSGGRYVRPVILLLAQDSGQGNLCKLRRCVTPRAQHATEQLPGSCGMLQEAGRVGLLARHPCSSSCRVTCGKQPVGGCTASAMHGGTLQLVHCYALTTMCSEQDELSRVPCCAVC
jgi:hypothetical protein